MKFYLIRGCYNATPGGWIVWMPMVGDIPELIDYWGSQSLAHTIAVKRNIKLQQRR